MQFKGRLIPDIPADERNLLKEIRSDSHQGAKWRDIAYAVLNQTIRGANYQKDGVALRALSSKKDDSQVGPVTIYSGALDAGNVIELAIHPEKLADALHMEASDVWAWLAHQQESVAHPATPKTSMKYPRIGIRTEDELVAILDSWSLLVANRFWAPQSASLEVVANEVIPHTKFKGVTAIELARVDKAAQDSGFDISSVSEGEWRIFRSTAFSQEVGVSIQSENEYRVGLPESGIAYQICAEFGAGVVEASNRWSATLAGVADYQTLHGVLVRVAAIFRVVAGSGLKQFEEKSRKLPDTTEAIRLVVQRVGQDIFRSSLLDYWGRRCAVSGLNVPDLLRASHIKPWAECASDAERLDVFNGLLLAPHLDALFDGGWITFSDFGQLVIADALDSASRTRLGLTGTEVVHGLADRHRAYLKWHRDHRFGRSS